MQECSDPGLGWVGGWDGLELGPLWLLTPLVEVVFAGLAECVCPVCDDFLIVRVHESFAVWTVGAVWCVVL